VPSENGGGGIVCDRAKEGKLARRLSGEHRSPVSPDLLIVSGLSFLYLAMLAPLARSVHVAEYDEAIFLDVARSIQRSGLPLRSIGAHGTPFLDHTPLYTFLLSLYAPPTGANLAVARGVTVLAGLLCLFLTFRIATLLGGRTAGAIAGAFVALNPFLAVYAYFVRMEMFMIAAMMVAMYLLVRRRPLRTPDFIAVGFALAVAPLFKEFALILVAPAAVYAWFDGGPASRSRLLAAMGVVGPPVLAMAAWAIWAATRWPAQLSLAMSRWFHSASGGPISDPRMLTGSLQWSEQLANDLLGPGLVLGLVVALLWLLKRRGRIDAREALLWGYLGLAVLLSYLVRLRETRHLIAIAPVAAILSGLALAAVLRAARERGRLASAAAVASIALLVLLAGPWRLAGSREGSPALSLAPSYRERLVNNDAFYGLLARAGEEAARLSAPDEVLTVAHQGPVIAYYADRHYLMLYTMDEAAIRRALDRSRFLVWDTPTWLALPESRVPDVEARVSADFAAAGEVSEGSRVVVIYQRKP
jgi:hypothetical protein